MSQSAAKSLKFYPTIETNFLPFTLAPVWAHGGYICVDGESVLVFSIIINNDYILLVH